MHRTSIQTVGMWFFAAFSYASLVKTAHSQARAMCESITRFAAINSCIDIEGDFYCNKNLKKNYRSCCVVHVHFTLILIEYLCTRKMLVRWIDWNRIAFEINNIDGVAFNACMLFQNFDRLTSMWMRNMWTFAVVLKGRRVRLTNSSEKSTLKNLHFNGCVYLSKFETPKPLFSARVQNCHALLLKCSVYDPLTSLNWKLWFVEDRIFNSSSTSFYGHKIWAMRFF